MTDLFNYDQYPEEAALGEAMARHHQEYDIPIIRERGVVPDWMGEPEPLSKDKARVLSYLYEHGCFSWTPKTSRNNRDMVEAVSLGTQAYAKSVIDEMMRLDLIETRMYHGDLVFEMTQQGEFALEEYELDKELGIL